MRSTITLSLLALLSGASIASGCGGTDPSQEFNACGGDVAGLWNFSGASVTNACAPTNPALTGFINFNKATGRYSVNGNVKTWKLHNTGECGFETTHAGFYRQEGSVICFADTPEALAAAPCDETAHTIDAPWSGAAAVCIEGSELTLKTSSFFGLSAPALLTLTRGS